MSDLKKRDDLKKRGGDVDVTISINDLSEWKVPYERFKMLRTV